MITITVNPLPSIVGRDTAICNGQTVDLSILITGTALSTLEYGTTFGTYGGSNSVSPSSTTTYFVRDSVDASGCLDTAMITITVNPLPSIVGRDTAICNGQTVDLSTLITGTPLSTLEYGTTFGTYGGSNSVSPSFTTTYFVRDSVDASGCVDTAMITVTVTALPSIVGRDTAICNGQTVDLSTLITGTALSTLEYGTSFGTYGGSNSVSPSSTTTYFVRDSVDASGCVDTAMIIITVNNCDWGDLPDTSATTNLSDYQTLSANNGPVHVIIPGLNLGTSVDPELDGQPSTDALGDGSDENGVTIFSSLDIYPGSTFRLPLNYENTTGSLAHIEAWIDWNGDGDFDDTDEMVFDVSDIGDSAYDRIEITSPTNAVSQQFLGFRIRISNQDNMTPYGIMSEGEVEDYLIGLDCPTQICVPMGVQIKRK